MSERQRSRRPGVGGVGRRTTSTSVHGRRAESTLVGAGTPRRGVGCAGMADSATPHGRVSGGRRGLLADSGALARFGRFAGALTRSRTARLEAERREEVERTRAAERRRIAGELHDVLAHRLSLLSLQAGALELRPDAPPDEAAQCAAIRTSAATAFEELRDVMAVL